MLFNSLTFLFFLVIVVILRWLVPQRFLIPFMLCASYIFYMAWEPIYIFLISGVSVAGYYMGYFVSRSKTNKKPLMIVSVALLLSVLAYFKYSAFLLAQIYALRGFMFGSAKPPLPEIILPLGISFFIFQLISYVVDVYRGGKVETNLLALMLYISFYPHQIAGPIVRTGELIPQFFMHRRFDPAQFTDGMDLLAIGYFKKVCLADNMAKWADTVFASPGDFGTAAVWTGVVAYAGQIYCDFSAYTDIARGAAKLMGWELPLNFNLPYFATSITDFWRRWHMSLSRWLRDYLYISLGGNRCSKERQSLNLTITMGLGGLWHGASWNFVIWGLYHGMLLLLHKQVIAFRERFSLFARISESFFYRCFAGASTFILVCFSWVVFRADTFSKSVEIYKGMFLFKKTAEVPYNMTFALILLGLLFVGHVIRTIEFPARYYAQLPGEARAVFWALSAGACYLLAGSGATFIYFQF